MNPDQVWLKLERVEGSVAWAELAGAFLRHGSLTAYKIAITTAGLELLSTTHKSKVIIVSPEQERDCSIGTAPQPTDPVHLTWSQAKSTVPSIDMSTSVIGVPITATSDSCSDGVVLGNLRGGSETSSKHFPLLLEWQL